MADRILVTTDDLEHDVRVNGGVEAAGFDTAMVWSFDAVRQAVRGRDLPPDCIILTGGLHETPAQHLLASAREHAISTLGLVDATEPDPKALARELGLTAWRGKPMDPQEAVTTTRRLIDRRKLPHRN